jgi:hypothetical protein
LVSRRAWHIFLIFIALIEKYPMFGNTLAVPGAIFLLALPAQWFLFVRKIGGDLSTMWRIFLPLDICPGPIRVEMQALRTSSTQKI